MVRFVTTDSFLKVFSTYNLKTKVATLLTSDKFDNDSIIYITDATRGNWIYVKGHLYGEDDSTNVSWTQEQQSGTKIASITIDGVSTDVYAPVNQGPKGDPGIEVLSAEINPSVEPITITGLDTVTTPGIYIAQLYDENHTNSYHGLLTIVLHGNYLCQAIDIDFYVTTLASLRRMHDGTSWSNWEIFSYVGPKGDKGATGAQGPEGQKGERGSKIFYATMTLTGDTYKEFSITEEDIAAFVNKNIYIYKGDNSEITKVSLITEEGISETTIWKGVYAGEIELNAETVASFRVGNKLRVYITVPESGANFKIVYKGAPDWSETTIPSIGTQWPWVSGSGSDARYKINLSGNYLINDAVFEWENLYSYTCIVAGNEDDALWVLVGELSGEQGHTGANGKSLEFTWGTGTNANKLGVRKEGDTNYTYSGNLKGETGPAGTYVNTDGLIAINGNNISLDHLKANLEIGEMDHLDLEAWFSGRDYPDGALFADAAVWNKIGEYITVSYKNLRILNNWNETLYSLPVLCELPTHGVVKAGGSGLVLYWSIVAQESDQLNVLRIAPLYDASLVWDDQTTITITYKFVLS